MCDGNKRISGIKAGENTISWGMALHMWRWFPDGGQYDPVIRIDGSVFFSSNEWAGRLYRRQVSVRLWRSRNGSFELGIGIPCFRGNIIRIWN